MKDYLKPLPRKHQTHHVEQPHRDFQLGRTVNDWSPFQLTEYVRSLFANDPTMLPSAIHLSNLSVEHFEGTIAGDQVDTSTLQLTDGVAPGSSPTPTVTGGLGLLAVKWTAITNNDSVGYQVHISTTTDFTPDATTLSQKIVGTLAIIRAMPDGTALSYTTTYYVKIVAFDDDGVATTGAQATGSPTQVGTADIVTGSVTAELLEATLVLGTTIETATTGARVKIDPTGIKLFNSTSSDDNTGLTMNMDAQSGTVSIRGQFDFGADPDNPSRLTNQDVIDIVQQSNGFQTPGFVRAVAQNYSNNGSSTINQTLAGASTAGNLLVMTVSILKHTGTPQTITSPPASWTLIATNLQGQLRQYIYKYENAPRRTTVGSLTMSAVMGVNDIMRISVGEFSGCQVGDVNSSATGNGTAVSSGVTGAQAQAQNLVWGTLAYVGAIANLTVSGIKLAGSDVTGEGTFNGAINPSNSGSDTFVTTEYYYNDTSGLDTSEMAATLNASKDWIASVISFKAKTTTGTPDTPTTGHARLYSASNAAAKAQLHQIDEAGVPNSLALAPSGASYRLQVMSAAVNIPSTSPSTASSINVTLTGLVAGDYVIWIGSDVTGSGTQFHYWCRQSSVTTDTVTLQFFNADTGTKDPASETHYFLVIHVS